MARFTRKKKIALVTAALVFGVGGTAFAYWTQAGEGTGTAGTGTTLAVEVQQTNTITDLYPGVAQALSGNFDNPNAGFTTVGAVTAEVTAATKAVGAPTGTCDRLWYTVTGTSNPLTQAVPAGNAQGNWSGLSVTLTNSETVNQNACKGATITITYAVAAS